MSIKTALRRFCEADERLRRAERAQRAGETPVDPVGLARQALRAGALDPHAQAGEYRNAAAVYRTMRHRGATADELRSALQQKRELADRLRHTLHAMGGKPRETARQLGVGARLARKVVSDDQHVAEVVRAVREGRPIDKLMAQHVKRWKDATRNAYGAERHPLTRDAQSERDTAERYRQRIHKIANELGRTAGSLVPAKPDGSPLDRRMHVLDIARLHGGRPDHFYGVRGSATFASDDDARAAVDSTKHHYPQLRADHTPATKEAPAKVVWRLG